MASPAYPAQFPRASAPPPRGRGLGVLSGLFLLAAGGLAIGATFIPFYGLSQDLGEGHAFEYKLSGWSWNLRPDDRVTLDHPALYGIPLCVAGAVLVLASVLALAGRSARVVGVLGAGLVAGAVGMEFADAVANNQRGTVEVHTRMELGTWLLLGAVVAALVGVVFSLVRNTSRVPQAVGAPWPPRFEPETPRFGVPVQQYGPPTPAPPGFPAPPGIQTAQPGYPAPQPGAAPAQPGVTQAGYPSAQPGGSASQTGNSASPPGVSTPPPGFPAPGQ